MSATDLQQKLKDVVKTYEGKLAALNALNSALQKENEQLQLDLEEALQPKTESELEVQELKEEFARRLGEQQRTIDILKDTNQKLQAKIRDAAADSTNAEGQMSKLHSKVDLQKQDISTLTSKVAELQSVNKKLNQRVRELQAESDKQVAAAHTLEIQLQDAQRAASTAQHLASQDLQLQQQQHAEALQAAQDKLTATEARLQQQLASAHASAAAGSEQAAAAAAAREASLAAALADAQAAVASHEAAAAESEQRHRRAVVRLQDHVRQLEAEKQELLSGSTDASSSLLRQIQAISQQSSAAQASAAEQEQQLLSRLRAAEQLAAGATAAERDAASRAASAEAALLAAREAAAAAVQECAGLRSRLEAAHRHGKALEAESSGAQERLAAAQGREQALLQDLQQHQSQHAAELSSVQQELQEVREDCAGLQELVRRLQEQLQAATSKAEGQVATAAAATACPISTEIQQDGLQHAHLQPEQLGLSLQHDAWPDTADPAAVSGLAGLGLGELAAGSGCTGSPVAASAPHPKDGSAATAAVAAAVWLHRQGSGSQLSSVSGSPRASRVHQRQMSGLLSLEGQLQLQRSVQQLQQELSVVTRERDAAAEQLYQMVRQVEAAAAAKLELEKLTQRQAELQHKLDVAVEIIGERSLRIEELEEDIADMKDIFHAQLDEAAHKLAAAEKQQSSNANGSNLQPSMAIDHE